MANFSRLKRAKTPNTDCEVVTFSRLDYWSMLDLFDRIPLHDLVRLNGLASWWSGYVTKVCRTKRDITVQSGHKSQESGDDTQDQFNLLKVTTINPHTSVRLGLLLPNITSLELIIEAPQYYDIDDITHLISQWSQQLVELKIKCLSYNSNVKEKTEKRKRQIKLLHSLNRITTLRRLSIDCKWWRCKPIKPNPIDLSILSQLEYFYFKAGGSDFKTLRHSLVRYAKPNHNLKQVELPSLIWSRPQDDDDDLMGARRILPKFTILRLGFKNPTRDQWPLFPNLTTVNLGSIQSRSNFMELITGMQCLKLVRNLKLLLVTHDFDHEFDQVLVDLPQLSSVTNLKLKISTVSFTNPYPAFKSLQLGAIFPNLETVLLGYDYQCLSQYPEVQWMAKIWSKINYQMFKLRVRLALSGVECVTFKKPSFYF